MSPQLLLLAQTQSKDSTGNAERDEALRICSEIPFTDKKDETNGHVTTVPTGSNTASPLHDNRTRTLTQLQPPAQPPKAQRGMSVFSYLGNKFTIQNLMQSMT